MNSCSDATSVHQVRQTRHKCQIRRKRFFTSPLRVRRNFVSCWAEVQWATRLPLSSPQVNATQRSDVSRTNPPKRSDFRDEMFATNRRFNQFVRCRKRQPTPCLTYAESQSCFASPESVTDIVVPRSTASSDAGHSLTEQPTSGLYSTDKSVRYERCCQQSYVLSFHGLCSPSRLLAFRFASASPFR